MKITDPDKINDILLGMDALDSIRKRTLDFVSGPYKELSEMYSIVPALYIVGVLEEPIDVQPINCELVNYLNMNGGLHVHDSEKKCGNLIICANEAEWTILQRAFVYLGRYKGEELVFHKGRGESACVETLGEATKDMRNLFSYRFRIS